MAMSEIGIMQVRLPRTDVARSGHGPGAAMLMITVTPTIASMPPNPGPTLIPELIEKESR